MSIAACTFHDVTPEASGEVVSFVDAARRELFPMLADAPLPPDLARFEQTYLEGQGRFLVARDQGRLVAAIGYLPYDHRFAQLDYRSRRTVEVVRLFVAPGYRRGGLAGRLFNTLRDGARADGVECLYLHTHPFLPGAIDFWKKQGFEVVDIEDDPLWQTTHMHQQLVA
ncbi:GNAT family N-acetyltransferase [Pseudomonas sp. Marseille-QA0332]